MNEKLYEARNLKIFAIVWFLSISYALGHHFVNQTSFATFPSMFHAYLELYSQNFIDIASSSASVHAIKTGSNFPFLLYLELFLHHVTKLEFITITLIPLGCILIPLAYLYLDKSFYGNYSFICILCTINSVIYFVSNKSFRATYVSAFAIPVFIILCACLKKIYDKQTPYQYSFISILMLSFLVGLWHTMAFTATIYVITIVSISYIMNLLFKRLNLKYGTSINESLNVRWSLAIVSFVMLVYFKLDHLSPYLSSFVSSSSEISDLIMPFIRKLSGEPTLSINSPYQYNYADTYWGKIYFISNLWIHIVSSFMILFGVLLSLKLIYCKEFKNKNLQIALSFTMAAIISQIIISILYSKTGTGFFYIIYIFPLLGAYLLFILEKKKIAIIFLACLIFFGCTLTFSSHLTGENDMTPVTKYDDMQPSFSWIYSYKNEYCCIYADFNVLYSFLSYEIKLNPPTIWYKDINSVNYGYIVGDSCLPETSYKNYVAIDEATMSVQKPINIYEGRGLLSPKLDEINSNRCLNKIYLDDNMGIYLFK